MKYLIAVLLGPLLIAIAAAVWMGLHFTAIAAEYGDEWLLLSRERAAECLQHGGCAVFSVPELQQALQRFIEQLQQTPNPRSHGAPT